MAKRFRTSMTSTAGHDAAVTLHGRITNVNIVNWTVDVISQFDRKYYYDIQVGAAYLHYNNGEGIYVMPEVGAVVMVTLPSDSSPPYVQCFVAPMETANAKGKLNDPDTSVVTTIQGTQEANPDDVDDQDAPQGTRSRGGAVPHPEVDARFDAGRPPAKPGDIFLRTRDGNFITLHRGGVLELGATEIAKRIYIPIGNKILDVSGQYEHQSTGGTVAWGIQEVPSIDNPPAQEMQTYRLFANDQYMDIRIAKGKVLKPVPDPPGSGGEDAKTTLGMDGIIVYEVVLAQQGFRAVTGELVNGGVVNNVKLKFFFDQKGNTFLRSEGSCYFAFKKKVKVEVGESIDVSCDTLSMTAKNGATIDGGPSSTIRGDVVRLQAGVTPVARLGDAIQGGIPVPVPCIITFTNPPGPSPGVPLTGVISIPAGVLGAIISGNPNLLG